MSKKVKFCGVLVLACSAAWAQSSKLSPDLAKLDPHSSAKVIVQWKRAPTVAANQNVATNGGLLGNLVGLVGSVLSLVVNTLTSINATVLTLPVSSLSTLAADPNVLYISPDRTLTAKLDNTAAAVNASAVWKAGYNGSGIGVAVLDSGINSDVNLGGGLLGLGSRVVYSQDFLGGNGQDAYGHGQHVAGIIASNGASSNCLQCTRSFVGLAPGAKLLNFRVLDADGNGSDSSVIAAIEQAIALKNKYNIRVINLSLGRPVFESYTQDPLCQAVEAAWKAGIVVVVAAGNDGRDNSFGNEGYGTVMAPGNDPYVITVGAMRSMGTPSRTDDLVASYSSKGPSQIDHIVKPDIMAPGNQVVSLFAHGAKLASESPESEVKNSYYQSALLFLKPTGYSNSYLTLSGTSMATPVVSGAVADLLQAKPSLTPNQVKTLLMLTAYKTFPTSSTVTDGGENYVSYYDIFTVGAGYLDLKAALASINQVPAEGNALSPIASYDSNSGDVTLNYDPSSVWGDRSVWGARSAWGARAVWGASVLSGDNDVIWGARSAWGQASDSSDRSAWGARCVWGARSVWGAGGGLAPESITVLGEQ
jgi:serine protease AprX